MDLKETNSTIDRSRYGLGQMPDYLLDEFRESATRLYDPANFDHCGLNPKLSEYKTRDLISSKLYRLAQKIFGDKMDPTARRRKRTLYAPPMEEGPDARLYRVSHGPLLEEKPQHKAASKINPDDMNFTSDEVLYREWVNNRRKLREGLDNLGLTEKWLKNKPERNVLEEEIYQEFVREKKRNESLLEPSIESDELLLSPDVIIQDVKPLIRRPSPLALRKLDRYLRKNKMRLLDLFRAIDKAKTWNVSEDEFLKAIKENKIDISQSLLEDLLSTLDANNDGRLYYKDLAKGMDILRIENREMKRKGVTYVPGEEERPSSGGESLRDTLTSRESRDTMASRESRVKSVLSPIMSETDEASQRSSPLLEVPPFDMRADELVLPSTEAQVDIRKRDIGSLGYSKRTSEKELSSLGKLERMNTGSMAASSAGLSSRHRQLITAGGKPASQVSVFKTGYKAIDDHSSPSTMIGETGDMINDFRQLKLKEYYRVMQLCEEKGIALSRELLDRVLLYPGDKSHKTIMRQGIRQAGCHLPHSSHFADPPKRPRTPIEIRNRHKMRRDENGELLIDYRHLYPERSRVAKKLEPISLPTGKCLVSRKVDCWMTFEEYEKLTREYEVRYVKLHGDVNENAFWPGKLLERIRLYLPHDDTQRSTNPIFETMSKRPQCNYGYDNNLNNWKVNDRGYLVQGSLRHPKTF